MIFGVFTYPMPHTSCNTILTWPKALQSVCILVLNLSASHLCSEKLLCALIQIAQGFQPCVFSFLCEPQLMFGWMYVDVDPFRRHGQKQHIGGLPPFLQYISKCGPERVPQHRVAHRATVDAQILYIGVRARVHRTPHVRGRGGSGDRRRVSL